MERLIRLITTDNHYNIFSKELFNEFIYQFKIKKILSLKKHKSNSLQMIIRSKKISYRNWYCSTKKN